MPLHYYISIIALARFIGRRVVQLSSPKLSQTMKLSPKLFQTLTCENIEITSLPSKHLFEGILWLNLPLFKVCVNLIILKSWTEPEYIDIVYICLHVNYLIKILYKPKHGQIIFSEFYAFSLVTSDSVRQFSTPSVRMYILY